MKKLVKVLIPKYRLSPLAEGDLFQIFESTIESWSIVQAKEYAQLIVLRQRHYNQFVAIKYYFFKMMTIVTMGKTLDFRNKDKAVRHLGEQLLG